MSKEIFISYSRRDQEFVTRLARDLNEQVAFVWLDRSTLWHAWLEFFPTPWGYNDSRKTFSTCLRNPVGRIELVVIFFAPKNVANRIKPFAKASANAASFTGASSSCQNPKISRVIVLRSSFGSSRATRSSPYKMGRT